MTVGNPENFKIQIKTGREEVDNRVPCDFSNLTLKKLYAWIDSQSISRALKSELKRSAATFPHQALKAWQGNFDKYLSKAQARLRKKKKNSFVEKVEDADVAVKAELEEKTPLKSSELSMSASEFAEYSSNEFDSFNDEGPQDESEPL